MSAARRRRGALVGALSLLVLVMGGTAVVMSVTNQARVTRLTHSSLTTGRYVAELASSGIDETLADFSGILSRQVAGRNMRQQLLDSAVGGLVPGPAILGVPELRHSPERTLRLIEESRQGIALSPVILKPLHYSITQNHGEIELECAASFQGMGTMTTYRRWTMRFYFQLDQDGVTFRVNPVASSAILDRSKS